MLLYGVSSYSFPRRYSPNLVQIHCSAIFRENVLQVNCYGANLPEAHDNGFNKEKNSENVIRCFSVALLDSSFPRTLLCCGYLQIPINALSFPLWYSAAPLQPRKWRFNVQFKLCHAPGPSNYRGYSSAQLEFGRIRPYQCWRGEVCICCTGTKGVSVTAERISGTESF